MPTKPFKINQKVRIHRNHIGMPFYYRKSGHQEISKPTFEEMRITKVIDHREELGGVFYITIDNTGYSRIIPHHYLTDNPDDFLPLEN